MQRTILRLCILSTFLLAAFSVVGQSTANYSLLWRISKPGTTQKGYLFGTMHYRSKEVYEMSDSVLVAFDRCKAVALELNFDSVLLGLSNSFNSLLKKYGEQNRSRSEVYVRIQEEMQDAPQAAEPHVAADDDYPVEVLDIYLQHRAQSNGVHFVGLERPEDQVKMLLTANDGVDYDRLLKDEAYYQEQKPYLESIISLSSGKGPAFEALLEYYATGNLDQMQQFIEQYEHGGLQLEARNRVMLKGMLGLLQKYETFVAVGAAHLPGKEGLIALLRQEGYVVERVEATFTGVAQTMLKAPLKKAAWQQWSEPSLGLSVTLPATPVQMQNTNVWLALDGTTMRAYGLSSEIFMPTEKRQEAVEEFLEKKLKNPRFTSSGEVKKRKVENGYAAYAWAFVDETSIYYTVEWHDDRLYTFFITAGDAMTEEDEDLQRFLSSARFFPVVVQSPSTGLSTPYTNALGGYTLSTSGLVREQRKEEVLSDEGETTTKEIIYLSTITFEKLRGEMLVRFSNAPEGSYYDDREQVYAAINSNFDAAKEIPESQFSEGDTIIGDIQWRKVQLSFMGTYNITLTTLRGSRVYVLAVSGGKALVDAFWQTAGTFKFIPLQQMPMVEKDEIGIASPRPLEGARDTDVSESTLPIDYFEVRNTIDTLSGALYNVIRYHLHPSYVSSHPEKLIREFAQRIIDEEAPANEFGETAESITYLSNDSSVVHAAIVSPDNDLIIEVKVLALGREIIALQSIRPAELNTDVFAAEFMRTDRLKPLSDSTFLQGNVKEAILQLPYIAADEKPLQLTILQAVDATDVGFDVFEGALNALYEKPGTEDVGEISWLLDQVIALDTLRALALIQKWVTNKKNLSLYEGASYKMSFVTHPEYMRFYLKFLNDLSCPSQEAALLGLYWNSYDLLSMVDEMKTYCRKGNQCMMDYLSIVISNNVDSLITPTYIDDEVAEWMLAAANRALNGVRAMQESELTITPQDVLYHTTRVLAARAASPRVSSWLHSLLDSTVPLQVRAEAIKPLLRFDDASIAAPLEALLINDHTGFDIKQWAHVQGLWTKIPEKHRDQASYCKQYLQYAIDVAAEQDDFASATVKASGSTKVKSKSGEVIFYHFTVRWVGDEEEEIYSFGPFDPKKMMFDVSERYYLVGTEGYSNVKKAMDDQAKKMAEEIGQFED